MPFFLLYASYLCIGYGIAIFVMTSCHDDYIIQSLDDIEQTFKEIESDDYDF